MSTLKFALPKGSLEERTFALLSQAGYAVAGRDRSYTPSIDDREISLRMSRPQEIPSLIAEGSYDLGISGIDWIHETNAYVRELVDLEYGRVKLILAVPADQTGIASLDDLIESYANKAPLRIATEYLNLTSRILQENAQYKKHYGQKKPTIITPWYRIGDNPQVRIMLSFGATEAKPPQEADAIIDNTETGSTLHANHLKIIGELMVSTARLIANKNALKDPVKREKILDIVTLLRGAVDARKKLHIFANVREENLDHVLKILPALKSPTVSKLSQPGWLSINTIIDRAIFLSLIPDLRRLVQGLIVYEPRQVLPLGDVGEMLRNEKD